MPTFNLENVGESTLETDCDDAPDVGAILLAFRTILLSCCSDEANRPLVDSMRNALAIHVAGNVRGALLKLLPSLFIVIIRLHRIAACSNMVQLFLNRM